MIHKRCIHPDFTLTADASNLGWGAVMGSDKVQGEWEVFEQESHINVEELLAVYYGLQYLVQGITNYDSYHFGQHYYGLAH